MMTRDELLRAACALFGETPADDPDTERFKDALIARTLGDLRPAENLLRARDGVPPLLETPAFDDGAIPYHEELTDGPLVYLTAAALMEMNGETAQAERHRALAKQQLRLNMPALCGLTDESYPCWRCL